MSSENEWPLGSIIMRVKVDIKAGTLTLVSPSALINPGLAGWNPSGLVGKILVNGSQQATLSFSNATRAMTASSAVTVTTGDTVEVRWQMTGGTNVAPWDSVVRMRRSAFFDVPAADSTFIFDRITHPMPVPDWLLTFGWDASNSDTFKASYKASSDDGASQDMTVTTRRISPTQDVSSATIDLDITTAQGHSAAFTKSDVGAGKFELEMLLKSDSGTTYMQDKVVMTFNDKDDVPTYAGTFPGDTLLESTKVQGGQRLAQPW
ncbi:MAG: hypothetical protein ACI8RZ_000198 [Myxococcota bacterium]|jgi:hypothetical protein